MKPDSFIRPGLQIYRHRNREGLPITFVIMVKNSSRLFADDERKAMLKFIAWPASTPTGQEIREWLKSFDEPKKPVLELQQQPLPKPDQQEVIITPGSWDPASHPDDEEPNDNTKTII
jgi:hypothetical protein